MPSLKLTLLVPWVITHGYFIFFIATIIEGTMVTIAAGVATGLGYFNIWLIILIAISGDLIADTFFYLIGYYSRSLIIEKHGHLFGLTKERVEKIEKMVHNHLIKTMVVIKLSPFIPIPGLIAIGATRVSIRRYIETSLLITVPKATFFVLLGFYSAKTYMYLSSKINNDIYIISSLILIIAIIFIIFKKISSNTTKNFPI